MSLCSASQVYTCGHVLLAWPAGHTAKDKTRRIRLSNGPDCHFCPCKIADEAMLMAHEWLDLQDPFLVPYGSLQLSVV